VTRVAFLIRSLGLGGAERQLVELVKGLDKNHYDVCVFTFYPGGALEAELSGQRGVRIECLEKSGRWDTASFLKRLIERMRDLKPHIIHGYLPVANELALLAGRMCGARVIWGIRAADVANEKYDWTWDALQDCAAFLSRYPDRIICNSHAGREHCVSLGYSPARMHVISNGIDTNRFRMDAEIRARTRQQLGVSETELLVGRVGRQDPMKDWECFLRAFGAVSSKQPVRALCVTNSNAAALDACNALAAELGITERLIWVTDTSEMVSHYNAMDVNVSSSRFGEGFPNVLAEAMACGVPCAATDVGDSAFILGDTGRVVPREDPAALAVAIEAVLGMRSTQLSEKVRHRIESNFSVARMVQQTSTVFDTVLGAPA